MSLEVAHGDAVSPLPRPMERADHRFDNNTEDGKRCSKWLVTKRRLCAAHPLVNSPFCGNHDPAAASKRVPCPVDQSHSVLKDEVDAHVRKCQATKHLEAACDQPYFKKGINAGESSGEEDEVEKAIPIESSEIKRAAIVSLTEFQYQDLVKRIEATYEACCSSEVVEDSVLLPPQCLRWWDADRDKRLPFQEKHVSQQASLLGNLEAYGLLNSSSTGEDREKITYVEFGAGRGYLSQMLCDSYEVSSVVMVERKAYKYKADRTLRQLPGVSMQRLRTDIEDLYIHGVESLRGCKYVAVSKHLCGPATDMTLRCCLLEVVSLPNKFPGQKGSSLSFPNFHGLGIATCCHHLCQWRSYVNKDFFHALGFTGPEFQMISWLTSWAVNESGEHDRKEHESSKRKGQTVSSVETCSNTQKSIILPLSEVMSCMDSNARIQLGRKCKFLIDFGRLQFLRRTGLEAKIVNYTTPSVSPENKLLLARKLKHV